MGGKLTEVAIRFERYQPQFNGTDCTSPKYLRVDVVDMAVLSLYQSSFFFIFKVNVVFHLEGYD